MLNFQNVEVVATTTKDNMVPPMEALPVRTAIVADGVVIANPKVYYIQVPPLLICVQIHFYD